MARAQGFFMTVGIALLVLVLSGIVFFHGRYYRYNLSDWGDYYRNITAHSFYTESIPPIVNVSPDTQSTKPVKPTKPVSKPIESIVCNDPIWCSIKMPSVSYFRFTPPTDKYQWRLAQSQAASGEQVLLKGVRKVMTNHMDFLEGNVLFRKYQELTDLFLDHKTDLFDLTHENQQAGVRKVNNGKPHPWERWYHGEHLPPPYDYRTAKRAPIVQLGYNAFSRENHSEYFQGGHLGEAVVDLPMLRKKWVEVKDKIIQNFIFLHAGNENWGLFSTEFPNRTIDWGQCCERSPFVQEILDHPKVIAVFVNQHHNLTHPKLVSFPRGMPLYLSNRKKYIFDMIRLYSDHLKKDQLLFASASSWKHRPYISACIEKKFVGSDKIEVNTYNAGGSMREMKRMTEVEYYRKIASAYASICLSGLGYDSFRLWETLTMGTMPVIEKGVGFDKTLWRLPALLVEDFDIVTPALLRSAYVEAIYQANAGQFEFERLTQSFWWSFVMNVSTTNSQEAIFAKFPPESEDPTFARPRVPYDCGNDMSKCGPGTKRTPRSSCGGKPK